MVVNMNVPALMLKEECILAGIVVLCPHHDNIPSNCHLITKAGQCCKEVKCEFTIDFGRFKGHGKVVDRAEFLHSVSESVIKKKATSQWFNAAAAAVSKASDSMIMGRFSSIESTPSVPSEGACLVDGKVYKIGETWKQSCSLTCVCEDGHHGIARCFDMCATFSNLPSRCRKVKVHEEPCCQMPVCNTNESLILVPSNGKGIIGIGKVTDPVKEGCVYKNIIYQEGEKWIDGCTYLCECTNGKRGMYTCNERCERFGYIPDSCHLVNDPNDDCCEKLVCNAVSGRPKIQTTPATVGNCYYKGQMYKQGETWYDECSLRCFCEDAQTGYYHCTDRCFSFSSIPADCTSKPDPNDPKCCKVFDCGKKNQNYGLIGIKDGFGKSLQPDNKYKSKNFFLNSEIFFSERTKNQNHFSCMILFPFKRL
ncbi:unnamed protein product [Acanthosepion pharaonis]|uniref:VWFC domain-containing protein n=1 Tax=Acanthosepion pharaonis TaxID=158019 RepID=A0A812BZE6_ACAPH|nr:unnamed protein product [Sepia pharaonis]